MSCSIVVSYDKVSPVLDAISDEESIDTNQVSRRRIGDEVPVQRKGGAKPKLFIDDRTPVMTPPRTTTDTTVVDSERRLLEE